MPQGIIVRDAQGRVTLDLSTRCGRVLGFHTIPTVDGSIWPPGADQGTLFAVVTAYDTDNLVNQYTPTITITSSAISWSWGGLSTNLRSIHHMVYGVY